MNCEGYQEAIGDLAEGAIKDEALRIEVEKHLRECASCRALLSDLRQIRAAAAHLPTEHPPAHVWDRIAAQLPAAQPARPTRSHVLPFQMPRLRFAWAATALMAAAVVVLVVAVPGILRPRTPQVASTGTSKVPNQAVHANSAELVQTVESELQLAEQHYEKAIAGLEQIANAGEGTLDPQLAGTLKKNLGVIDQAINDSRNALRSQPTNELVQESLFEAFRRKVALLQDTVALINEMRKGNQAGAAKIVGGMNKS